MNKPQLKPALLDASEIKLVAKILSAHSGEYNYGSGPMDAVEAVCNKRGIPFGRCWEGIWNRLVWQYQQSAKSFLPGDILRTGGKAGYADYVISRILSLATN